MKKSKELKMLEKALEAYYEKHGGNVIVNVSVCAFDENDNVIDDYLWLAGDMETLLTNNECMSDVIKNDYNK